MKLRIPTSSASRTEAHHVDVRHNEYPGGYWRTGYNWFSAADEPLAIVALAAVLAAGPRPGRGRAREADEDGRAHARRDEEKEHEKGDVKKAAEKKDREMKPRIEKEAAGSARK